MAQILLKDLYKSYGETPAVRGINLAIDENEFVVLVGPSGCGKTTTLRMIAGLEHITDGEIYIGERLINGRAAARSGHRDGVPELRAHIPT